MEHTKHYEIRLFDPSGQLMLVLPTAHTGHDAAALQAQQALRQHGAAHYELKTYLPVAL